MSGFQWFCACLLAPAGLAVLLHLLRATRREIRETESRRRDRDEALLRRLAAIERALESRAAAGKSTEPPARSAPRAACLSASKRAKILRLHRKGEPLSAIADAVSLPEYAVALAVDIQKIDGPNGAIRRSPEPADVPPESAVSRRASTA